MTTKNSSRRFSNGKASAGIVFILPARRRFLPNAWLSHADGTDNGDNLVFKYSTCSVHVTGKNLFKLIEYLFGWELEALIEGQKEVIDGCEVEIERIDIEEHEED
jgi:hypothetical protein